MLDEGKFLQNARETVKVAVRISPPGNAHIRDFAPCDSAFRPDQRSFLSSAIRARTGLGALEVQLREQLTETRDQVAGIAPGTAELIGWGRELKDGEITVPEGRAGDLYGLPDPPLARKRPSRPF